METNITEGEHSSPKGGGKRTVKTKVLPWKNDDTL